MMSDQKFDITQLVTNQQNIDKIKAGEKTAIRRNDRYADTGETIDIDGKSFAISKVYQQKLGDMTDEHAKQEGFSNLEEYKESLTSIHRGAVWDPDMTIWVHEFKAN